MMKKKTDHSIGQCRFAEFETRSHLKNKRRLGSFINALIFQYTEKHSNISYTFVSDEYLIQMNNDHLKHDTYTDIITFDLSNPQVNYLLGDIYISIDRVIENAHIHKCTIQNELLRVIIHGALHLAGFGDKTKAEAIKMRQLEDEWMLKFDTIMHSENK